MSASRPQAEVEAWAAHVQDVLRVRRQVAERRRQPRGAEGSSFIPGLVHELRNLVFSLGAGLDALEARFSPEGPEAEHVAVVRRNLDRFQGFMRDLQAYATPAALRYDLVAVMPCLQEALGLARPRVAARKVEVAFEGLDPSPMERMDRDAWISAAREMVEVAAAETVEGGTVQVRLTWQEGGDRPWMRLTVQGRPDRGRELDLGRLFEPFYYRAPDMPRLGAATARRTVEAHGGQLAAFREGDAFLLSALLPVWKEEPS